MSRYNDLTECTWVRYKRVPVRCVTWSWLREAWQRARERNYKATRQ